MSDPLEEQYSLSTEPKLKRGDRVVYTNPNSTSAGHAGTVLGVMQDGSTGVYHYNIQWQDATGREDNPAAREWSDGHHVELVPNTIPFGEAEQDYYRNASHNGFTINAVMYGHCPNGHFHGNEDPDDCPACFDDVMGEGLCEHGQYPDSCGECFDREPHRPIHNPFEPDAPQDRKNLIMNAKVGNWTVTALGESQQATGVGTPPVQDPAATPGPNFSDNAGNSREQEVAVQVWVDTAIDMLNRGMDEQAVVAQLAHDGCPDPQGAVQRALKQPMQDEMQSNEPFEDPNQQAPSVNEADPSGAYPGPQQGTFARVTIADTSLAGDYLGPVETMFGTVHKVALDSGHLMDVDPSNLHFEDAPKGGDPVSAIQEFIDSFPRPDETPHSLAQHTKNLHAASAMIAAAAGDATPEQATALLEMGRKVEAALAEVKSDSANFADSIDRSYVASQPKFAPQVYTAGLSFGLKDETPMEDAIEAQRTAATQNFDRILGEQPQVLALDMPVAILDDPEAITMRATQAAQRITAGTATPEFVNEFVERTARACADRLAAVPTTPKTAAFHDPEGPAEGLFL